MNFEVQPPVPVNEPGMLLVGSDPAASLRHYVPSWSDSDVHDMEGFALRGRDRNEIAGVEALAAYRSFRNTDWWGISIKKSSIQGLAWSLQSLNGGKPRECIETAYRVFYGHERFHFQVDCAYLRLETQLSNQQSIDVSDASSSLYLRSRSIRRSDLDPSNYDPLEEALANARAWRFVKKGSSSKYHATLRQFLLSSPLGYRDFPAYESKRDFMAGLNDLPVAVLDQSQFGASTLWKFEEFFDLRESSINGMHVPVYILEYE